MKLTYQEIIDSDLPLDELWHRVSDHIKKLEAIIRIQDKTLEHYQLVGIHASEWRDEIQRIRDEV